MCPSGRAFPLASVPDGRWTIDHRRPQKQEPAGNLAVTGRSVLLSEASSLLWDDEVVSKQVHVHTAN